MKYFVQYPIQSNCNLQCPYCFNEDDYSRGYYETFGFLPEDYIAFRDTHLKGDILMEICGGETFLFPNISVVVDLFQRFTQERFELLTNGTPLRLGYERIIPFKDRVERIGFTFHRKVLGTNSQLVNRYRKNLLFMKEQGFDVYVKEIYFSDEKEQILKHRDFWKKYDVPLKIQPYRPSNCALDKVGKLDAEGNSLLDDEYSHFNVNTHQCNCKKGHKGLIIKLDGTILACWHSPTVVGNIRTGEFTDDYYVTKKLTYKGWKPIRNPYVCVGESAGFFSKENLKKI